MAAYNKFSCFPGDLGAKVHTLATDVLKLMLTDTAPVATNTVKANITEIAAGNGYAAGGIALSSVTWTQAAGLWTLAASPLVITASGGSIAQFRYLVVYNSTPAAGNLIAFLDYGSECNISSPNTFTVAWSASGILTVQ